MGESDGLHWTYTIDQRMAVTVKVTFDPSDGRCTGVDLEAHAPPGAHAPEGSPWQYWGHTTFVDLGRSMTVSLQHAKTKEDADRVLAALCKALEDSRFQPAGRTDDPYVPVCRSVVDYAAKSLRKRVLEGRRGG